MLINKGVWADGSRLEIHSYTDEGPLIPLWLETEKDIRREGTAMALLAHDIQKLPADATPERETMKAKYEGHLTAMTNSITRNSGDALRKLSNGTMGYLTKHMESIQEIAGEDSRRSLRIYDQILRQVAGAQSDALELADQLNKVMTENKRTEYGQEENALLQASTSPFVHYLR